MTYSIKFVKNNKFAIDKKNKCSYNNKCANHKGGAKTVTEKIITLEEAQFALKMMEKCSLNSQEAVESIDSYVERIRNISLSQLIERVINSKLTPIQKTIIEDYWFNGIDQAKIAEKLGVSKSAVYSAKTNAQLIIKDYLEPIMTYLTDIADYDTAPVTVYCFEILKAQKSSSKTFSQLLKNIRLGSAVDTAAAAKALGISEDELEKIEKGQIETTTALIENYSRIFKINITLECSNGEWRLKWTDR